MASALLIETFLEAAQWAPGFKEGLYEQLRPRVLHVGAISKALYS
jgi:hypothetical protein